jgi:hypothetical protein
MAKLSLQHYYWRHLDAAALFNIGSASGQTTKTSIISHLIILLS